MSILDSIPEVGNVVRIGSKIVDAFNKLMDNTNIREKFKETGRVTGAVTIYDYRVTFVVEDMKRTAIDAEVIRND